MKNTRHNLVYILLAGILLVPFLLIVAYSLCGDEINIGDFSLRKIDLTSSFRHEPTDAVLPDSLIVPQPVDTVVMDTTPQRILLFGDSMVEGLSRRLKYYAAANGHELLNVIWYSSSTKIWAQRDTLAHFIRQFKPTYLMLCLGGNELFVRDLDKRESYIQAIIRKMDGYPYVWIGPPNWKEDTGINTLFEKNAGTCRFFPSKDLVFKRASDGAHPTQESSNQWMDSVAVWIMKSCQPILMNVPVSDGQCGRNIVLRPLR